MIDAPFFLLMLATALLEFLSVVAGVASDLRPRRVASGVSRVGSLWHRGGTKLASWGPLLVGGIAVLLAFHAPRGMSPTIAWSIAAAAAIGAVYAIVEYSFAGVSFYGDRVFTYSPWTGTQQMAWNDVVDIRYSRWRSALLVCGSDGMVAAVSIHLRDIVDFVAHVQQRVPIERRRGAILGWLELLRRFPEAGPLLAATDERLRPLVSAEGIQRRRWHWWFVLWIVVLMLLHVLVAFHLDRQDTFDAFVWLDSGVLFLVFLWGVWSPAAPIVRLWPLAWASIMLVMKFSFNNEFGGGDFPTQIRESPLLLPVFACLVSFALRWLGLAQLQRIAPGGQAAAPWERFSLRSLFVVTTFVAVCLGSARWLGFFTDDERRPQLEVLPAVAGVLWLLTPGRFWFRMALYLASSAAALGWYWLDYFQGRWTRLETGPLPWTWEDILLTSILPWTIGTLALLPFLLVPRAAGYRLAAPLRVP